jgi:hypothetical protein
MDSGLQGGDAKIGSETFIFQFSQMMCFAAVGNSELP